MDRPTLVSLAIRLDEARRRFPLNAFYLHEASGDVYTIIGHLISEASGNVKLAYRPVRYDNAPRIEGQVHLSEVHFERAVGEFNEKVHITRENGGKDFVPRFRRVRRGEAWVDWVAE